MARLRFSPFSSFLLSPFIADLRATPNTCVVSGLDTLHYVCRLFRVRFSKMKLKAHACCGSVKKSARGKAFSNPFTVFAARVLTAETRTFEWRCDHSGYNLSSVDHRNFTNAYSYSDSYMHARAAGVMLLSHLLRIHHGVCA